MKNDIQIYISKTRKNIFSKFTNFCATNHSAPLAIKLKVLNACLVSTILYGCECWGSYIPKEIESLYRMAIKTALSVRSNTNNEIIYIEAGLYPLECLIRKRQLKFWLELESNTNNQVITYVLRKAEERNLKFASHYKNLKQRYQTPTNCVITLQEDFKRKWKLTIETKFSNDPISRLGTYLEVNPRLENYQENLEITELERIILTRFRTGAHNLKIECGRHIGLERDLRLCNCEQSIQTVKHIVFNCTLLDGIRRHNFNTLKEFLESKNAVKFLVNAMKVLKIKL